jgi:hypothetical protein
MDKMLIYGLFETLTVSAAGRYLEQKNLKIDFSKNNNFFIKNK